MSTRCQIGFYAKENQSLEKPNIFIYQHCDGYPENILPSLKEFAGHFLKYRNPINVGAFQESFFAAYYLA